jgi:hypothetical protein
MIQFGQQSILTSIIVAGQEIHHLGSEERLGEEDLALVPNLPADVAVQDVVEQVLHGVPVLDEAAYHGLHHLLHRRAVGQLLVLDLDLHLRGHHLSSKSLRGETSTRIRTQKESAKFRVGRRDPRTHQRWGLVGQRDARLEQLGARVNDHRLHGRRRRKP